MYIGLFNLRGSDIAYNPVFFAYALITKDRAILYVDSSKLTSEASKSLGHVEVRPYAEVSAHLAEFAGKLRIGVGRKTSWALAQAVGEKSVSVIESPVEKSKAIKNDTELEGFRRCHLRDAVALIEYMAWLERVVVKEKRVVDEISAANHLESLRRFFLFTISLLPIAVLRWHVCVCV